MHYRKSPNTKQYAESMVFIRILAQEMAERIVLEKISGKTFLLEDRPHLFLRLVLLAFFERLGPAPRTHFAARSL